MLLVINSYQHMPSFLLKALLSDRPQDVLHVFACDRPVTRTLVIELKTMLTC